LGVVDDVTKDVLLGMADVALNPIQFGSGTNLKMLDYLAAGVPVISSKFGMRGLQLQSGKDLFACELAEFGSMIDGLKRMPYEEISAVVENGRRIALEKYDWRVIAKRFHEIALPSSPAASLISP
jgi:glycosyltransferase involved in cell wall biosynthesis